jgi:uncharacterized protein (TIGR02145 family)
MKKIGLVIATTLLTIATTNGLTAAEGCNTNTPAFSNNLGKVSFMTSQTWTVGKQTWSDVVIAENCQKTTFNGIHEDGSFNADCRMNEGYGDLFSWCAIARFQNQLCPAPWRVPTVQDFIDLDIAMGGDGTNRNSPELATLIQNTYLNPDVWGGTRQGGYCRPDGTLDHRGNGSLYWSQSEENATHAYYLSFSGVGRARPKLGFNKTVGFALRCVR